MFWRRVRFVKAAMLSATAFLWLTPPVTAGSIRAGTSGRSLPLPQPAPALTSPRVASAPWQPVTISVVVTLPAPAKEPFSVDLRGPDGQVRRFAVEGGRAAIQTQDVVLRPGQTLTLHWVPAK